MKVFKSRKRVLGAAILMLGISGGVDAMPSQTSFHPAHPNNLAANSEVPRSVTIHPRHHQHFQLQARLQEPQYRWFCYIMGGRRKCFYF